MWHTKAFYIYQKYTQYENARCSIIVVTIITATEYEYKSVAKNKFKNNVLQWILAIEKYMKLTKDNPKIDIT